MEYTKDSGALGECKASPEPDANINAYANEISRATAQLAEDLIAAAQMLGLVPQTTVYRRISVQPAEGPSDLLIARNFAGLMVVDPQAPRQAALWAPHEIDPQADEIEERLKIEVEWVPATRMAIASHKGALAPTCAEVVYDSGLNRNNPLMACRLAIIRVAAAMYRAHEKHRGTIALTRNRRATD